MSKAKKVVCKNDYIVELTVVMKRPKKLRPENKETSPYFMLDAIATYLAMNSLGLSQCSLSNTDTESILVFDYREHDPNNELLYFGQIDALVQIAFGKKVKAPDNCTIMHTADFAKKYKFAMAVNVHDCATKKSQVNYFAPNGKFEVNSKLKTLDGFLKKVK